jgi:hypothetical protein
MSVAFEHAAGELLVDGVVLDEEDAGRNGRFGGHRRGVVSIFVPLAVLVCEEVRETVVQARLPYGLGEIGAESSVAGALAVLAEP